MVRNVTHTGTLAMSSFAGDGPTLQALITKGGVMTLPYHFEL